MVLITHEPDVAEQAKRVISLSDGQVVEDRRTLGVHDAPPLRSTTTMKSPPRRHRRRPIAQAQP